VTRLQAVGSAEVPVFRAYCAARRFDHDESFLDEHSLSLFRPGEEEKAVMLVDGGGLVRVAASLMLQPSCREMGRARVRIFHAGSSAPEDHGAMLNALLPVDQAFRDCFLFLRRGLAAQFLSDRACRTGEIVRGLGFASTPAISRTPRTPRPGAEWSTTPSTAWQAT
jgi:hypothetical protein